MVWWDTRIALSSGKFTTKRTAICGGTSPARGAGDRQAQPFVAGELAPLRSLRSAAVSATNARYMRRPPLRASSRLIVDGARPSRRASSRQLSPVATPRLISSRSARVSCRLLRRRGGQRTPPVDATKPRTVAGWLDAHPPRDRLQRLTGSPLPPDLLLLRRTQTERPHRPSPRDHRQVSQRPTETATVYDPSHILR